MPDARTLLSIDQNDLACARLDAELRQILSMVTDCLWSADVDRDGQWTYRYLSPVIESISGRPPEAFQSDSHCWFDLVHPEDRALVERTERELLLGKPESINEYRIIRPDGSIRWVRDSVRACDGRTSRRLDGVIADITDQVRATEALRRSEERFRTLVEKSSDAVTLIDAQGIITYTTPSSERITGRPTKDVIGRSAFDLVHPEELNDIRALHDQAIAEPDRDFSLECRYLHADGSWRIAEATVRSRLADPDIRAVVVNFRDVTERRQIDAQYRDLVEHAPISIYEEDFSGVGRWFKELREGGVTDLRTFLVNNPDMVDHAARLVRVRNVNRAALEQAGAATKEELVASLAQHFTDQSRKGFTEKLIAMWSDREEFEYESRAIRLDGQPTDVIVRMHVPRRDGRPNLEHVIVTLTDITARRRAEEGLGREHRMLRTVLNSIPDLISYTDEAGVYRIANGAFAAFFGLHEEEIVGRRVGDLFPSDVAKELSEADARVLAGGPPERIELWLSGANGNRVLFETLRVPLSHLAEKPTGLIGISRDITARRQLEEQLRQAGKLKAVGQLAGGVAHDFNNLLTAILGNLSLVQSMLPADHAAQELLYASDQAAWRAAELTRQLLGFARRSAVRLEPIDLNQSITETLAILRRTFDPRIVLDVRMDPNLSLALADVGQVNQVLMNLCLNSRDAMPEGGTLTLESADVEVDDTHAARIATARSGPFVRLTVADTGDGIQPGIRDRIFEPFFTTKDLGQGTGLGLALVHGIITQHRGWLEVESAVGRGTRFDIYLPRAHSRTISSNRPEGENEGNRRAGTILLADDDSMIRTLGQAVLEEYGYQVLLASDGEEVIETYRREGQTIDLVILDLTMPRINGRDACRALRQINPNVRVLLSSGFSDEQSGAEREPCVRGFVAKPYRPNELAVAVAAALKA